MQWERGEGAEEQFIRDNFVNVYRTMDRRERQSEKSTRKLARKFAARFRVV